MPAPLSLIEFTGIAGGVCIAIGSNMMLRKPILTGIYKHVALGAVGYFAGQKLESMNNEAGRRNLLVIEDYVARHPEDFVEETPKTYGEILMKWYPVR